MNEKHFYTDAFTGESWVTKAWYDETSNNLYISFYHGPVYRFRSVSAYTWEQFKKAPSKGTYYNANIVKVYSSAFIGNNVEPEKRIISLLERVINPVESNPVETKVKHKVKVTFDYNGQEKYHTLPADSISEVIEQFEQWEDAFGVELKLKEATVHFE